MTADDARPRSRWTVVPRLVIATGIGLFLCVLAWAAVFRESLAPIDTAVVIVLTGVPALGIAWAGRRLARSDVSDDRYRRIAGWTAGVCLVFLLVNLASMVIYPITLAGNVIWMLWSIVFGTLGGFAVGYVEARAIQREVEAAAARARAEQLEEEREMLGYLNDLLRHEVFNSTQIIGGHASLLLEDDHDDRSRDRLETIRRESESLGDVIDDVRAMLGANLNATDSHVDLSALIDEVAADLRSTYPEATIDVQGPESVLVVGNDGLKWVVSNVVENGIEHDDDDPHVTVTLERRDGEVVVTVSDDGPGIPPETRERLFERKSRNHGLGLYLTRILGERYGGTVELAETGPEGSIFTVRLPLAATDDRGDGTHDAGERSSDRDGMSNRPPAS
ncbi:sensor histidine kinase [Halobiforma nitratireducens]|uniref:histidine kinase n=1 Tax=Halobiforma nitratireducens JCM 10879 TaxID=1227454 RepID=M0MB50_9EURY|nr:HAMP domain-containing sensor histidine kinase [Halobiforma nitratireducens]EMA41625.1 ATP-binding region ATPase domain protein [Halobiforma nitratireducens JCM 10879]